MSRIQPVEFPQLNKLDLDSSKPTQEAIRRHVEPKTEKTPATGKISGRITSETENHVLKLYQPDTKVVHQAAKLGQHIDIKV